jgi:hypothetical protein
MSTILLGWCFFCWTSSLTPSLWPIFFYGLASLSWLGWALRKHRPSRLPMAVIFAFWLITRIPTFWATPYSEDDYYRYLWDGWVTLHGGNALVISPQEVMLGEIAPDWPDTWTAEQKRKRQHDIAWRQSLLPESPRDDLLSKITFPKSPSIYGPFGQVFLALSALPMKLSMVGWMRLKRTLMSS